MDTRQEALNLVNNERNRQDTKWGEQNHPPQFWTGILGEEFGEYCEAVNETVFNNGEEARAKGGVDNMIRELTHVAAVAVGAIECLLRNEKSGNRKKKKTNEQMMKELEELAKPLNEWLHDNGDPHSLIQIQQGNVQLFSGEIGIPLPVRD